MKRTERRRLYYAQVKKLTAEKQIPRKRGHTLDHIVPVSFGFKHSDEITPEMIASRENLRMIPFQENLAEAARMTPRGINNLVLWGLFDMAYVEREKLKRVR